MVNLYPSIRAGLAVALVDRPAHTSKRALFGKNPNEPETGVNLRQHEIYTDADGFAMKTGEREHRSDPWKWVEDGYRVIARRPRSEVSESIDPDRADAIEDFTEGLMPMDRW